MSADWIAERARIEQAATDGPWFQDSDDPGLVWGEQRSDGNGYWSLFASETGHDATAQPQDAEFIADARTALPKALSALEAVLKLHEPVAVYAQADECECGNEDHTIIESEQGDDLCWDTPTGEQRCGECLDEDGGYIDYPCPTVVLIREALDVSD